MLKLLFATNSIVPFTDLPTTIYPLAYPPKAILSAIAHPPIEYIPAASPPTARYPIATPPVAIFIAMIPLALYNPY
ncbi:MAG: hypothetical protein WCD89_02270 [Anaerocolumna sp.]